MYKTKPQRFSRRLRVSVASNPLSKQILSLKMQDALTDPAQSLPDTPATTRIVAFRRHDGLPVGNPLGMG